MDSSQAIKITSLQRMLEYYGPRQVSLIGDACQEFSAKFIDIVGSAVLHKTGEKQRFFELDQFFAVDVGKQAFMIKAKGDKEDFCLFTEVLLDALEGDAQGDYFDTVGVEKFVTSHSLARYLKATVAKEAGKYGVQMNPYPRPGFFTDTTYLRIPEPPRPDLPAWITHLGNSGLASGGPNGLEILKKLVLYVLVHLKSLWPPERSRRTSKRLRLIRSKTQKSAIEAEATALINARIASYDAFTFLVSNATRNIRSELNCGIAISGTDVSKIHANFGLVSSIGEQPNLFQIAWKKDISDGLEWSDALVILAEGRIVPVCVVNGFITVLHAIGATFLSLFHREHLAPHFQDITSISLLAQAQIGPMSPEDTLEWAASVCQREPSNVMLGCITAQFYDVIRDVNSLRQMAAFYAQNHRPVPLDIILYGGGTISEHDGRLFAEIPAVAEREPQTQEGKQDEGPVFKDYPIAGRVPWMRQAWGAVATARCDASAEAWREQALKAMEHLAPGLFTVAKPSGHAAFFKLAGIRDIQDNAEHTRTR
jgi:hypothetical protein